MHWFTGCVVCARFYLVLLMVELALCFLEDLWLSDSNTGPLFVGAVFSIH